MRRRVSPKATAALAALLMAGFASFVEAALSAPSLTATPVSTSQVNLSWTDPNPNESGHQVERSLSSTAGFTVIASLGKNVTSYSSTGLAAGTTYYFRVKATTKSNSGSPYSNVASARTLSAPSPTPVPGTKPNPPSNLTAAAASPSQITLAWTDNSTNETAFKVERAPASAGPWTQIGTTAAAGYGDSGLAPSTTYYYRVRAYNSYGDSAYTNTASATTQAGAAIPAAPSSLSATAVSASQINLGWVDTSANETGFKIERSSPTAGWAQIATVGANLTTYASTGLAAATAYSYRVRAYNTSGDSAYSNTASATTLSGPGGTGAHVWSKDFGGSTLGVDFATPAGIAVDSSGASVVVGYLKGKADFGGGLLTSAGYGDVYLAKYAATGSYVWSQRFGGTADDRPKGVALDASGNIFITGFFRGTASFGGVSLVATPSASNAFLAKYSSSGAHLWSKRLTTGTASIDTGIGIGVDGSGNVIVGGSLFGTGDFGGGPLTSAGAEDVFLAKYSTTGSHVWSRRMGGASADWIVKLAVDTTTGEIVTTGYFAGSTDLGGGVFTSAGANDAFVAKYSSSGGHVWSRRWGSTVEDKGFGVAVDRLGNVAVTGHFTYSVDFGGGPVANAGDAASSDIFLVKISPTGVHLWSKGFGSSLSLGEGGNGVAFDSAGNVLLTGSVVATINFGGTSLTGDGYYNIFLAKFGSTGSHVWSKRYLGGGNHGAGRAVTADGTDNVLGAGDFGGSVNLGGATLSSPGGDDTYLVKLGP